MFQLLKWGRRESEDKELKAEAKHGYLSPTAG